MPQACGVPLFHTSDGICCITQSNHLSWTLLQSTSTEQTNHVLRSFTTIKPPESCINSEFRLQPASLLSGPIKLNSIAGDHGRQASCSEPSQNRSIRSCRSHLRYSPCQPSFCFKCLLKVKFVCLVDFLITILANVDKEFEVLHRKTLKYKIKLHFKQRCLLP